MKVFLMLVNLLCILQIVASLGLTLQPTTFIAQQSLWMRQPEVDGNKELDFDLRFVQGANQRNASMAVSGIHASSSQQFGTVQVVFPKQGSYEVIFPNHMFVRLHIWVSSNKHMGTSNAVAAISPPASLAPVSPQPSGTSSPASGSS
jgi:hypothetical protein